MLHLPSYNAGLAAGAVAQALGAERPDRTLSNLPAIERILSVMSEDRFFFPSSYFEGYVTAFDNPAATFAE